MDTPIRYDPPRRKLDDGGYAQERMRPHACGDYVKFEFWRRARREADELQAENQRLRDIIETRDLLEVALSKGNKHG
jgi:hypothetical protein